MTVIRTILIPTIITIAVLLAVAVLLSPASPAASPTHAHTDSSGCLIYQDGKCPSESPVRITTDDLDYGTTGDANAAAAHAIGEIVAHITATTTTVTPAPVQTAANYDPGDGSRWDQLAQCETGGNWATNTGNGFGGGLQFAHAAGWSTWRAYGGEEFTTHPWEATREQQIVIAERVLAGSGWKAWPGCSRKFGWL